MDELENLLKRLSLTTGDLQSMAPSLLDKSFEAVNTLLGGENSNCNVFSTLHMERREVDTHSAVLYFLLDKNGTHNQNAKYLHAFLKQLCIDENLFDESWLLCRERVFLDGRIDLYLECKDYIAVIEMKVDAGDQPKQLERYAHFAESRKKPYGIYYLTLDGHAPSKQSLGSVDMKYVHIISFEKDIAAWIENCLAITSPNTNVYSYLNEYKKLLQCLTGGESVLTFDDLSFLSTAKNLKGALCIKAALGVRMGELLYELYDKCAIELGNRHLTFSRETEAHAQAYYALTSHKSIELGIWHILDKTVSANDTQMRFVLDLHCDDRLYWAFYFQTVIDGKDPVTIAISEANKIAPAFVSKCCGKVAAAGFSELKTTSYTPGWEYISNLTGETFNFSEMSESVLNLADDMDEEVQYICDQLVQVLEKYQTVSGN